MDIDNLHLSQKIQKLLEGEEAGQFRSKCFKYCELAFDTLCEEYPHYATVSRLDTQATFLALDSAYIDLWRDKAYHDYENGPSPEKVGAALTAWLARIRPIHQTENLDEPSMISFLNPLFALMVGWKVCAAEKAMAAGGQSRESISVESAKKMWPEVLDIVYTLHWRAPNYKQMTLVFNLTPFLKV